MAFLLVKISEMFMTAIFMLFSRNGKWFRKRKAEITAKYGREAFADGKRCISKAKKKIECRIRHMIVRYFASEWCMTSLFQKGKIYGNGRFSLSFTVSSCTTKPLSSQFWLDNAEENVAYLVLVQWWGDDRQVSQSGKPLCTGASLWAVPKLARGLRPLEPRHVNGVSIPAKCPPDIPTEHLLID